MIRKIDEVGDTPENRRQNGGISFLDSGRQWIDIGRLYLAILNK